ncbi:sensor histidine kinase [Catellatospora sichuanensis]|uniref:sensor histidine kinase n=1 Tax=Catellatospora sichuanensis TaxID=1969805 RepID=UPI001181DB38|nr:histidine kinase [Catellatospora sichuanensis]
MLWVGRLFEERYTAVRLTLVVLSGIGYLTLTPEGRSVSVVDLALAIGVLLFAYIGVRWPFASVVWVSLLLGLGSFVGGDNDTVPTVGLAWAMFELGARRGGWRVWTGLGLGLAAHVVSDQNEFAGRPQTVAYGAAAAVAAPLLLGLHVRALGELNRQAAARAAQEQTQVRADERTSIARELHDLVAHHVASIVLRVAVARDVLRVDDPRVRQVLDDVHATGSSALADLRKLVTVLRDPGTAQQVFFVDPQGLPVALQAAVERSNGIGLNVQADIDPEVIRLDSRTALALLRLTQEGLANVARHAGTAARARLSIRLGGDEVAFDLRDFGGPVSPGLPGGGHGLVGLRERVEVLGGRLQAGPVDAGWLLSASLPRAAA